MLLVYNNFMEGYPIHVPRQREAGVATLEIPAADAAFSTAATLEQPAVTGKTNRVQEVSLVSDAVIARVYARRDLFDAQKDAGLRPSSTRTAAHSPRHRAARESRQISEVATLPGWAVGAFVIALGGWSIASGSLGPRQPHEIIERPVVKITDAKIPNAVPRAVKEQARKGITVIDAEGQIASGVKVADNRFAVLSTTADGSPDPSSCAVTAYGLDKGNIATNTAFATGRIGSDITIIRPEGNKKGHFMEGKKPVSITDTSPILQLGQVVYTVGGPDISHTRPRLDAPTPGVVVSTVQGETTRAYVLTNIDETGHSKPETREQALLNYGKGVYGLNGKLLGLTAASQPMDRDKVEALTGIALKNADPKPGDIYNVAPITPISKQQIDHPLASGC